MAKAHPGFKSAQASIAKKEGIPMANAGAILASSSRKASPAAKKKNPRLNRVKGSAKSSKSSKKEKAKKRSSAPKRGPSPIGMAMGMKDPSMGATY